MPELPEVETVRNTLKNMILHERITDIKAPYEKIIKEVSFLEFKNQLIGKTLQDILRKGKFLIFIFDDIALISHLRMEGKYFIKNADDLYEKHEHVIFEFASNKSLRYHDTRKFGTMHLRKLDDIYTRDPIHKLGYEIFDDCMTVSYLKSKIKNSQRPIKAILLDQTIIAGFGNIYVDEVCFLSKIHPSTKACMLDDASLGSLITNGRFVLEKAIQLGGTTIRSYTSSLGVTGRFQNELQVHMRKDEECYVCKTIITKIRVAGRGTYICHNCQDEKRFSN